MGFNSAFEELMKVEFFSTDFFEYSKILNLMGACGGAVG
jgi:hypothetical protein